jgi:hypothetical protein
LTLPNLIGAEQNVNWLYNLAVGKSVNERAITITRTKDGDCFYTNRDVAFKVIKRDIAGREYESESTFQFTGGTGKYEDIKGGGTCRGKVTAKEVSSKCEGEWEY